MFSALQQFYMYVKYIISLNYFSVRKENELVQVAMKDLILNVLVDQKLNSVRKCYFFL